MACRTNNSALKSHGFDGGGRGEGCSVKNCAGYSHSHFFALCFTIQTERLLGGKDIPYDPVKDECKIGEDETGHNIYGACNPTTHFPSCDGGSFICYNRVNRRDKFHADKNPYYYIDPRRVLCYPNSWLGSGGCSSCTPGRYCLVEGRCILDEKVYNCTKWL